MNAAASIPLLVALLVVLTAAVFVSDDALAHAEKDFLRVPGGRRIHRDCLDVLSLLSVHAIDAEHFSLHHDHHSSDYLISAGVGIKRIRKCDPYPRPLHGPAWKAWTEWQTPGNVTSLYGEWQVPPPPKLNAGQILYFWNGVEPGDNSAVLQPVLQYGKTPAGGGQFWAMAAWYVSDTNAFFSKLLPVDVGDFIMGNNLYNNNDTWTITAMSKKTRQTTAFSYHPPSSNYTWAYQVLEAYSISSCIGDYPTTDKVTFSNIKITVAGKPKLPLWTVQTKNPSCKENAQIVSPTEIDIVWD